MAASRAPVSPPMKKDQRVPSRSAFSEYKFADVKKPINAWVGLAKDMNDANQQSSKIMAAVRLPVAAIWKIPMRFVSTLRICDVAMPTSISPADRPLVGIHFKPTRGFLHT